MGSEEISLPQEEEVWKIIISCQLPVRGADSEDGPGGYVISKNQHLNYTFDILRWVLNDWDVMS